MIVNIGECCRSGRVEDRRNVEIGLDLGQAKNAEGRKRGAPVGSCWIPVVFSARVDQQSVSKLKRRARSRTSDETKKRGRRKEEGRSDLNKPRLKV
jgi:hypothetical protein